tara:strand:+ start:161 stop:766 length:606 start_codon:yes stop_codon:yes gene_type:complete
MMIQSYGTSEITEQLSLSQKYQKKMRGTYGKVNRQFPKELPYITREEAFKAYKLLMSKFGKKKVRNLSNTKWITKKLIARRTRPRRCWIALTGDSSSLWKGWRRLVHDVSHRIYDFQNPNASRDHSQRQAEIELEIGQYVMDQGWLQGKLKPKAKPILTKDEKIAKKISNLEKLLSRWETKQKTAHTYIKKYKTKIKRLSK